MGQVMWIFIDSTRNFKLGRILSFFISLPPLAEQKRIVNRIEQHMQICDELQCGIQQRNTHNERFLQGALRDALRKREVEE